MQRAGAGAALGAGACALLRAGAGEVLRASAGALLGAGACAGLRAGAPPLRTGANTTLPVRRSGTRPARGGSGAAG